MVRDLRTPVISAEGNYSGPSRYSEADMIVKTQRNYLGNTTGYPPVETIPRWRARARQSRIC
jgi:hypothetical protein